MKLSLIASYQWLDKRTRPATVVVYAKGALATTCEKNLKQGTRIYCEAHVEDVGYIADEIIVLNTGRQQVET